jgi:RNA recognition motif-containing protein
VAFAAGQVKADHGRASAPFATGNWLEIRYVMNTNLYVGNLPYNASEQDLIDLFGQAGEVVSAQVISDRETGRSRGFAFVKMATSEEAQNAIEQFNEQEFMGRRLLVNEARPRDRDGGGSGPRSGGGRYGGSRD